LLSDFIRSQYALANCFRILSEVNTHLQIAFGFYPKSIRSCKLPSDFIRSQYALADCLRILSEVNTQLRIAIKFIELLLLLLLPIKSNAIYAFMQTG